MNGHSTYQLAYFLAISVAIHLVAFLILPGPSFESLRSDDVYQVVSVVPLPPALAQAEQRAMDEQVDWLEALEGIDTADTAQPQNSRASSNLFLPKMKFQADDFAMDESLSEPALDDSQALPDTDLPILPSDLTELEIDIAWKEPDQAKPFTAPPDQAHRDITIETKLPDTQPETEINITEAIEGPAASRSVISKPAPPQTALDTSAVITLKFWVFPDGTVGKIIPMKKGDAELERIAINYLKQWRFSPLPKEAPQEDQWGIIPIKFKIF